MNRLLQPPEFLLAEQYASALTTLGLALCWMPVLPISPLIATLGLFLGYWAEKVVALRWAGQTLKHWLVVVVRGWAGQISDMAAAVTEGVFPGRWACSWAIGQRRWWRSGGQGDPLLSWQLCKLCL